MRMEDLLLAFYNAPDSETLHKMVVNYGLDGRENWRPYGGNPNNAGTFENQQSSPENALVEKITNSIDAILMLECYKRGIDPKDTSNPQLPRTMVEAIDSFYGLKNGKWENVTSKRRNEIAQNIQVIASSDKKTPNIAIYDNGEGQNPDAFETTLLSIQRGNKNDIPFVQGKYNFGATGAVVFCGEDYRYQMIISRRHEDIGDGDGLIGFTLVRKHILTKEEESKYKLTWYEYLVIDGQIPRCDSEGLPLGLNNGAPFKQGTIVKMYSYQLSHPSNITLDLWRDLNPLLFEPAMPILMFEARDFRGHSMTKPMLGNRTRIEIDGRDNVVYQKSLQMSLFGSDIPILVYVFSQQTKNSEFIAMKSVIYTLNGQTQGAEGRSFISQDVGFRNLRDYMLVCVDCSNITTSARQELFMASRDRLKQGKYYNELHKELVALLKSDDDIKQWNQDYKGKIFKESGQDKDLIESLFSKLKGDKDIRRMLSGSEGAFSFFKKKAPKGKNPESKPKDEKKQPKLVRYPTFFKIKGANAEGDYFKAVSKGTRGRIKVETDVANDFLSRSDDPGSLEITILDYGNNGGGGEGPRIPASESTKIKVSVSGPYNGEMQFAIEPREDAIVGDIIPISMKLISSAGEEEVIAFVRIEKEPNEPKKKPKEQEEPELSLPKLIRVFQSAKDSEENATWDEFGMTAESIVKYQIGEENSIEAILINVDSNLVKKLVNARNANVARVRDRYVTAMYSHSLMLYTTMLGYYSQSENELDEDTVKLVQDNLSCALESAFHYYANFIMTFEDMAD